MYKQFIIRFFFPYFFLIGTILPSHFSLPTNKQEGGRISILEKYLLGGVAMVLIVGGSKYGYDSFVRIDDTTGDGFDTKNKARDSINGSKNDLIDEEELDANRRKAFAKAHDETIASLKHLKDLSKDAASMLDKPAPSIPFSETGADHEYDIPTIMPQLTNSRLSITSDSMDGAVENSDSKSSTESIRDAIIKKKKSKSKRKALKVAKRYMEAVKNGKMRD